MHGICEWHTGMFLWCLNISRYLMCICKIAKYLVLTDTYQYIVTFIVYII